jgi:hypothetical protein
MPYTVCQKIATLFNNYLSWVDTDINKANVFIDEIEDIIREKFPSGSGFNAGTIFNETNSKKNKLMFTTFFHHMDEHGGYNGWTDHDIIVTPDWNGYNIRVTGKNRNNIKEYISETFCLVLDGNAD